MIQRTAPILMIFFHERLRKYVLFLQPPPSEEGKALKKMNKRELLTLERRTQGLQVHREFVYTRSEHGCKPV